MNSPRLVMHIHVHECSQHSDTHTHTHMMHFVYMHVAAVAFTKVCTRYLVGTLLAPTKKRSTAFASAFFFSLCDVAPREERHNGLLECLDFAGFTTATHTQPLGCECGEASGICFRLINATPNIHPSMNGAHQVRLVWPQRRLWRVAPADSQQP